MEGKRKNFNIHTHKYLWSDLYIGLELVAGPVLLILIAAWISRQDMPYMVVLVLEGILLLMVDLGLDSLIMGGILDRDQKFGLLQSSFYGKKLFLQGLLLDHVRRFLQYTLVFGATGMMIYPQMMSDFPDRGVGFFVGYMLGGILLLMATAEAMVLLLRRQETLMQIWMLLGFLSPLTSLPIIIHVFTFSFPDTRISPWVICIADAFLLGIILWISQKAHCYQYDWALGLIPRKETPEDRTWNMGVFIAFAFGLNFLMVPLMYLGYREGMDLSVFLVAQMFYPACGVCLAKLFSRSGGDLPRFAYRVVVEATCVLVFCCIYSIPALSLEKVFELEGATTGMLMYTVATAVVLVGSIAFLFSGVIGFTKAGRFRIRQAGLGCSKVWLSLGMIVLFFVLYFGRVAIITGIEAICTKDFTVLTDTFAGMFMGEHSKAIWFGVLLNLPLTFLMFFGEEYGWRYFLQPVLQKRFGMIRGVLLLGVIWGVWHVAADFLYYSDGSSGLAMCLQQLITCVSLGIFFGYAYLKTHNIWVPVMFHYLNNNLIMVIAQDASETVIQGAEVTFGMLPVSFLGAVVFMIFIFAPIYRKKEALESLVADLTPSEEWYEA
ncbi:MAG: CPBP family intramembrane metalloprotease [Lachnospiraceae bacterium]|nr:CPBP family intramembrane metalloprotease [Lachnospiraceae bacterium]